MTFYSPNTMISLKVWSPQNTFLYKTITNNPQSQYIITGLPLAPMIILLKLYLISMEVKLSIRRS